MSKTYIHEYKDLIKIEFIILSIFTVLIILFGIYPNSILKLYHDLNFHNIKDTILFIQNEYILFIQNEYIDIVSKEKKMMLGSSFFLLKSINNKDKKKKLNNKDKKRNFHNKDKKKNLKNQDNQDNQDDDDDDITKDYIDKMKNFK